MCVCKCYCIYIYCSIRLLGLDKQWGTYIYKNIILYFYLSRWWCLCEAGEQSESSCTERSHRKSELPTGTDFSQNSRPYIVLKLQRNPHTMHVFHWSWLTPTHCLLFISHSFHPHNACFSLVTAYTHTFLISGNHFVDFIYSQMYLSTTSTEFIASQSDILQYQYQW